MNIRAICKDYFNGFQEMKTIKSNDETTNVLTFLKVFSYFTLLCPLGFGIAYGMSYLLDRVSKKEKPSEEDKKIQDIVNRETIPSQNTPTTPSPPSPSSPPPPEPPSLPGGAPKKGGEVKIPIETTMHNYPGDLASGEKAKITYAETVKNNNESQLQMTLAEFPNIDFMIRRQNIFDSGAEVIVNAANTHLGGGGGVDGAIHQEGGEEYKKAHREEILKLAPYKSQGSFISGHAAMITGGNLKNKGINHVIVVAGCQGPQTSPEKERDLYSCYYNSLVLAEREGKTKIAIPSIATGIYGFPKDRSAEISLRAVYDFLQSHPSTPLATISIHFLPTNPSDNDALEDYKNALK